MYGVNKEVYLKVEFKFVCFVLLPFLNWYEFDPICGERFSQTVIKVLRIFNILNEVT